MTVSAENRERNVRRQALTLGMRVRRRNGCKGLYEIRTDERVVLASDLTGVEAFVRERYVRAKPGAKQGQQPPVAWAPLIEDFATFLAASGRPSTTIELRRYQVSRLAREISPAAPADVTTHILTKWMGAHPQWSTEYRRSMRSGLRLFFRWAFKAGHLVVDPADDLPGIQERKAAPRPIPDSAWASALSAADKRTTLMLRLAGEAGLRRAEVACVSTRDLMEGVVGAQLLVHGKGNKERVVPLSDSLAELVRLGAPGHTPGTPPDGWLFPDGFGGHLTPLWVSSLVKRVLPPGYTMHQARHRFATRAYRGSRNLRAVQVILGHSTISATERYTAVDDDEIRAAMMSAMGTV